MKSQDALVYGLAAFALWLVLNTKSEGCGCMAA
jgi:hypothetical protein